MWTTAVYVEQGSNEDIMINDDDDYYYEYKSYLVHYKMTHLFKTLLEEYVLSGIVCDELHKN
jgi:capsid protein